MKTSQELQAMADFAKEQEKLGEEALNVKGKLAKYYSAQYSLMPGQEGEFVGLACKSCNMWNEYGHHDNCPIIELEEIYESVNASI